MRSWDVLLLGGASGVGKTHVSYRLAHHFEVGLTEVDDFQIVLERMTTPKAQPAIHFWRTHPDPMSLSPEEIVANGMDLCRVMAEALEPVIANHLSERTPVVLEGDFILPDLASKEEYCGVPNDGRVRLVIVEEDDEAQLVRNFHARVGEEQRLRARVSVLYGRWLKNGASEHGGAVVPARPWETVFERTLAAIASVNGQSSLDIRPDQAGQ